jgi:hypothetical protein
MVMRAMVTGRIDRASGVMMVLVLAALSGCLGDRPMAPDDEGSGGAGGLASGGTGGKATGGAGGKGSGGAAGASSGTGGGVLGSGGAGGAKGTGGVAATGGATGTGGLAATGGATGSGGAPATGGATGTGGSVATGGAKGTGGIVATGGVTGTGGMVATGGATGTGGIVATGGAKGTGGIVATGGVTGTGGIAATGGVTGTGGTAPVCTLGQTRCVNSNTQSESCQSNGQWGPATNCMYACIGTACGGSCMPGQQQCSGNSANMTCGTNYEYQAAVACPLASPPNPVCAGGHCAYHAGLDQSGGQDSLVAGYIYAVRFQVSASTQAFRLGMFTTAIGNGVKLGLYSETALGTPGSLLSSTASLATVNGVVEGALAASTALTANAHYWIGAISSTTLNIGVTPGGAGFTYNSNGSGWAVLPSTFPTTGAVSNTAETPDFYVVLQDQ